MLLLSPEPLWDVPFLSSVWLTKSKACTAFITTLYRQVFPGLSLSQHLWDLREVASLRLQVALESAGGSVTRQTPGPSSPALVQWSQAGAWSFAFPTRSQEVQMLLVPGANPEQHWSGPKGPNSGFSKSLSAGLFLAHLGEWLLTTRAWPHLTGGSTRDGHFPSTPETAWGSFWNEERNKERVQQGVNKDESRLLPATPQTHHYTVWGRWPVHQLGTLSHP